MLASLMSMNALAIDIMLPALGMISDSYALLNPNSRQHIITSYILGMGVGAIVYGSLADRFGRRPVLLATLAAYVFFGFLCAVPIGFDLLLAARFAQGLAAASMAVVSASIVRDIYSGDAMAKLMSTVAMIFLVVPVLAPMAGQAILLFAEWHVIFLFLGGAGSLMFIWVWLRLPETLDPANVRKIDLPTISRVWRKIIFNRNAGGHIVASGLVMGALFGFLTSAQQVFFEVFKVPELFVFLFAVNAAFMSICNFTNSRIVERFGARRVSQSAVLFLVAVSAIHLFIAVNGWLTLPIFVVLLALCMGMVGFTGANFQSIAMEDFGQDAGAASSFQTFVRTVLATMIGGATGLTFNGSAIPLISGFLFCGIAAYISVLWAEKWRPFQRRYKH